MHVQTAQCNLLNSFSLRVSGFRVCVARPRKFAEEHKRNTRERQVAKSCTFTMAALDLLSHIVRRELTLPPLFRSGLGRQPQANARWSCWTGNAVAGESTVVGATNGPADETELSRDEDGGHAEARMVATDGPSRVTGAAVDCI